MTIEDAIQTVIIDKLKATIIANDMVATRALLNSVRFEKKRELRTIKLRHNSFRLHSRLRRGSRAGRNTLPNYRSYTNVVSCKRIRLKSLGS